jgi:outer membrane protein OmpA-like peptidoglycan-associated protein
MTKSSGKWNFIAVLSVVAVGAAFSLAVGQAFAEDVTEDQIVRALTPSKRVIYSRGLSIGPQTTDPAPADAAPASVAETPLSAAESKFVESIRGRSSGSLTPAEREEIATIAKNKPNIDLTITFDYKSADISDKSLGDVEKLGRALTSADLKGSVFLLAGHTDAAGGDSYNQRLSERRADSIKRYLVRKYHINPKDLLTAGYGKSKLKDPNEPLSEANRRVQVVNMANSTTASK